MSCWCELPSPSDGVGVFRARVSSPGPSRRPARSRLVRSRLRSSLARNRRSRVVTSTPFTVRSPSPRTATRAACRGSCASGFPRTSTCRSFAQSEARQLELGEGLEAAVSRRFAGAPASSNARVAALSALRKRHELTSRCVERAGDGVGAAWSRAERRSRSSRSRGGFFGWTTWSPRRSTHASNPEISRRRFPSTYSFSRCTHFPKPSMLVKRLFCRCRCVRRDSRARPAIFVILLSYR